MTVEEQLKELVQNYDLSPKTKKVGEYWKVELPDEEYYVGGAAETLEKAFERTLRQVRINVIGETLREKDFEYMAIQYSSDDDRYIVVSGTETYIPASVLERLLDKGFLYSDRENRETTVRFSIKHES